MKTNFKLFSFLLALTLLNCKKQNTFSDYKYSDKPAVVTCDNLNDKLYKEALYAFENDIHYYYKIAKPEISLVQSYNQFVRSAVNGRIKYEDFVSKHTLDVFNALKNEDDLWDAENTKSHLNYKGSLMNCIAKNIKDEKLKKTLNSLISINSMSPKLFGAPLMSKYNTLLSDKHLAAYVAFDLFYTNLFNIDFSKIDLNKPEKPKAKVDFNKRPQQQ